MLKIYAFLFGRVIDVQQSLYEVDKRFGGNSTPVQLFYVHYITSF